MKHLSRLPWLTLVGVLVLASCQSSIVSDEMRCRGGFCVRVQIQEPVRLNEPVTVAITARTNDDVPGTTVTLERYDPSINIEGPSEWTLSTRAQQLATVKGVIRFTQEGIFEIVGVVHAPSRGAPVADSQYVRVTSSGATIYTSGTPLPITPVRVNTSTAPLVSPGGTVLPTPTRAPLLTPTRPAYP